MFVQTQNSFHRVRNPHFVPFNTRSAVKADIKIRNRYINARPCVVTKEPDEVSVFALMTFGMPMRDLREGEPVFYDVDDEIFVEV